MRAIILAAGKSTRLRPITNNLPKCLLKIKGQSIISRQINLLKDFGISEIIIITGFKSNLVVEHLKNNHPEIKFHFIKNEIFSNTGPAYSLWLAKDFFNDDLLYLNSDLVCDKIVMEKIIHSKHSSITAISKSSCEEEQVRVVANGKKILRLGKNLCHEKSIGEFIGLTKLDTNFLSKLKSVLENYVKQNLNNKFAADSINDTISQYKLNLYWLDVTKFKSIEVDTIEDFNRATKMWSSKTYLNKLLTLFKIASAWVIYLISYTIPKTKHKIIFLGWHKNQEREIFADNSKYLFLHISNNKQKNDWRPIWISSNCKLPKILQDHNYEAYSIFSIKGIYHSLTAQYFIIDAMLKRENWQFSGNSKIIQLWHGKGMKKTGYDGSYSLQSYNKLFYPELFTKYYKTIASSEETKLLMSSTFQMDPNNIFITGLPRNDILFREIPGATIDQNESFLQTIKEFQHKSSKKIIAYMPTFRPGGYTPLDDLNLSYLNEWLQKKEYYLAIIPHPKFSNKSYSYNFSNIKIIKPGFDIYPLLNKVDTLITDYSSVYVDFLLLNKKIIFFTPDRKNYEQENGLHKDYDKLTPGHHPLNQNELIDAIDDEDHFQLQRQNILTYLHTYIDGNSSMRVVKNFFN